MDTQLEGRAPQARCYKCGSSRIARACHHCGRIGCSTHIVPTPIIAGRPLSWELRRLGMGRRPACHCEDCGHVASLAVISAGVLAAVALMAGFGVLWVDFLAGLVVIGAGAGAGVISYVAGRRQVGTRQRLPLPVLPRVEELSLKEELHGRATLRPDGGYEASVDPVEGKLTAVLAFGKPDRQRLDGYLGRYRLARDSDVEFAAGCLVLSGPAGINLTGNFPQLVIPLKGMTAGYPVFHQEGQRASSFFRAEYVYHLTPDREPGNVPLWVTPAVAPRSDRRTLELQIQWGEIGEPESLLTLEKIESFKVRVPVAWGNIEAASPPVMVGPLESQEEDQILRAIEWAQLMPREEEASGRRLELVVQFEEQISGDSTIYGRIDAVFEKAVSGIRGVRFFGPLGSRRSYTSADGVKTHVVLDFELSLASTRYQDIRLVPDRKIPEDVTRNESEEYPGVVPGDETVIALTNALSDEGYYIKRIIENPPRSGTRANLVRRYWDIAGRRYDGVYPIDFHIILTGEEIHRGGIRAHSGTTKTRLTVQGSFANTDMLERVEQAWERLHDLTGETLRSPLCSGQPRPGQADPGDEWLKSARGAGSPGGLNGAGAKRAPRNSARLLELLGLLDEALLHGRISDERYWEMRERAEQQLGGG